MSTSIMPMPCTEKSTCVKSTGSSHASPVTVPDVTTQILPPSSLKHSSCGDRPRLLGMPGSGLRISFASDTTFVERKIKTRGSSRGNASSLNLRPLEGGGKPPNVRIKLPKATSAMGPKQIPLLAMPSQEELMHPRRALDIARSYGVPKYFLRGNSQILTDGRMRLFADNVWKKERMSPPQDGNYPNGRSTENSDVICRLMDSVDKAIATSERPPQDFSVLGEEDETVGGLRIERAEGMLGERDKLALKDRYVSLPDVLSRGSAKEGARYDKEQSTHEGSVLVMSVDTKCGEDSIDITEPKPHVKEQAREEKLDEALRSALRPHTVDSSSVPGSLPQVAHLHYRGSFGTSEDSRRALQYWIVTNNSSSTQAQLIAQNKNEIGCSSGNNSLLLVNSGLKDVSDSSALIYNMNPGPISSSNNNINNRVGVLFGGKYRNVLPRFYPAVSAHHVRQREAALRMSGGAVRLTTTSGGQKRVVIKDSSLPHRPPRRLVRFADTTHTMRFSGETSVVFTSKKSNRDPVPGNGGVIASRAPVQSIQRSLDSHSGLNRPEWSKGGRASKCLSISKRSLMSTAANANTNNSLASETETVTALPAVSLNGAQGEQDGNAVALTDDKKVNT